MKQCTKCGVTKLKTDFYNRRKAPDGVQAQCKACAHEYYSKPGTLQKYSIRNRRYRTLHTKKYNELKSNMLCNICSEAESCCLDFHHLDPSKKDFNVSDLIGKCNWNLILEEIQKCICVCSNCHRKIHAGIISCPSSIEGDTGLS